MRRGAILGGTLVWAAPVVQTISMSAAHAQTSPPTVFDGPSYVAMNVVCNGKTYFVKFEGDENAWENEPGATPGCSFTPAAKKANGGTLGMTGSASGDCITISTGGCTITASVVKKGQGCTAGPTGSGTFEICS